MSKPVILAIILTVVAAFAYRGDLSLVSQRAAGDTKLRVSVHHASDEVVVAAADDGHFYPDAEINGTSIRVLADTGASMVVLSEADAERAGINVDALNFSLVVSTANGEARAAEVTLDEVSIGSISRRDVRAAVTPGLSQSLLGMSFFKSLSKVSIESNELVLRD